MKAFARGWFAFKIGGRPHASWDGKKTLCGRSLAKAHRVDFAMKTKACESCLTALVRSGGAWSVASSSRPGQFHLVERKGDGSFTCTCEAGEHSTECRHVRAVRKEVS